MKKGVKGELKIDRREFSRLKIPIKVKLIQSPKAIEKITIKDISYSGIGLFTNKRPQLIVVEILIPLPGVAGEPIRVVGQIVRKRRTTKKGKSLFDVGINFLKLREKDEDRLFKFIITEIIKQVKPYVVIKPR